MTSKFKSWLKKQVRDILGLPDLKDKEDDNNRSNKDKEIINRQTERNLKGIELEKIAKVEEAIELYEANINEGFEGNHPYDRLVIIYKKLNRNNDVKRVLEKAVYVFEKISVDRADRLPKLEKFKSKLLKIKDKGKG